ncbi:MAG TPA: hypothetical protein VGL10_01400, partial [Gammaproteobacteria bacterium]
MKINNKRALLLVLSILITFVVLRAYLHLFPGTNLNVGAYNIHHLFTGLLLVTLGGLPLMIFQGDSPRLDLSVV